MQKIVCIDHGHMAYNQYGVLDPGATGISSTEADIAYSVAEKLAEKLEENGYEAHIADSTDSLTARAHFANGIGADIFVSIHCNAAENHSAGGYEVWNTYGKNKSDTLADKIDEAMESIGLYNRGVKENNWTVIYETSMPSVLIELAFITNPEEERILINEQDKFVDAIFAGIEAYFTQEG